jgi:hypothetical protein
VCRQAGAVTDADGGVSITVAMLLRGHPAAEHKPGARH